MKYLTQFLPIAILIAVVFFVYKMFFKEDKVQQNINDATKSIDDASKTTAKKYGLDVPKLNAIVETLYDELDSMYVNVDKCISLLSNKKEQELNYIYERFGLRKTQNLVSQFFEMPRDLISWLQEATYSDEKKKKLQKIFSYSKYKFNI